MGRVQPGPHQTFPCRPHAGAWPGIHGQDLRLLPEPEEQVYRLQRPLRAGTRTTGRVALRPAVVATVRCLPDAPFQTG